MCIIQVNKIIKIFLFAKIKNKKRKGDLYMNELSQLDELEAEGIYIIREVAAG